MAKIDSGEALAVKMKVNNWRHIACALHKGRAASPCMLLKWLLAILKSCSAASVWSCRTKSREDQKLQLYMSHRSEATVSECKVLDDQSTRELHVAFAALLSCVL